MAVVLGNDMLAWFETATAGTFSPLKGQGTFSEDRSKQKIDTSDKTSKGYATGAFGLIDYSGSLDFNINLPDPTYTRVETTDIANTPIEFQIRRNGLAGGTGDVVFAAQVYASISNKTYPKDGVVNGKLTISLADAPTIDALS